FLAKASKEPMTQRRRERSRERLLDLLRQRILDWAAGPASGGAFEKMVEDLARRSIDPYTAADQLLARFSPPEGGARA
ncbi:MAG TPA: hypothetical protein VFG76_09180, partial [Candidatus Polarisedimenticolia bacterium]|nr:hypothetical protein [Candidatus Polarisedimenticolia bacterium]